MTDVYGTQEKIASEPFRDDLTKIKGIGATISEKLYNVQIVSIKQIAEMTSEKLSETPGIGLTTATKLIAAAKTYLSGSQIGETVKSSPRVVFSIKDESPSEIIEKYEVAEVVVDEIEEISEETQKEVVKIDDEVEEKQTVIDYEEQAILNKGVEYEEESIQEKIPKIDISQDQVEIKKDIEEEDIDYAPVVSKIIEFNETKESSFESNIHQQISNIFKDVGCYEIPRSLESLNQFTTNLDYLGCKLLKATDDLKFLFLFPVKLFDLKGTVLVGEEKLEFKSHSKKNNLGAYNNLEQISQNLIHVRDSMYEDLLNRHNFREFFQKYLQLPLSLESGFGHTNLFFLSGSIQYKVVIEPILLCKQAPRSMEKSLIFPYQRSTNLHAIDHSNLNPLIRFLEKKYRMIESRTKRSYPIKEYQKTKEKFRSKMRLVSIPVFGYAFVLTIIYFSRLYYLLRLFNTIGFAFTGIYVFLLIILYLRAYNTKKNILVQFKTPYYLQDLDFSEIDLLDIRSELTDELMTQFGFECLGKHARFGVIEQVEANTLKNNLDGKKKELHTPITYESEDIKEDSMKDTANNYGTKYGSFLED